VLECVWKCRSYGNNSEMLLICFKGHGAIDGAVFVFVVWDVLCISRLEFVVSYISCVFLISLF
jgi:hypothetical protein